MLKTEDCVRIRIQNFTGGAVMQRNDEPPEVVPDVNIAKKFGELAKIPAIKKDGKNVDIFVDICAEQDYKLIHPDIEDELLAAKVRFVRFKHPMDKDTILVLHFTNEKGEEWVEVLDQDAERIAKETNGITARAGGKVGIYLAGNTNDLMKTIGNYPNVVMDVTEEQILQWDKVSHPEFVDPPQLQKPEDKDKKK